MMANSYPKFVDDKEHPESYHLKIYKNDEEKKFIHSLPDDESDKKRLKIEDIYMRRFENFRVYVDERIEWIKEQTKEELSKQNELRKNIRVLIILGSAVEKVALVQPPYIKHNEDIVTTLLLKHLFKFAFGIPEEQIFLTSSNPDNFPLSPNVISPSTSPSKDNSTLFRNQNDTTKVNYSNQNEFRFFKTVFAQVGEFQYHFHPSYNEYPKIHPFNKENLRTFKTDENSELFVFFLDHSIPGYFQDRNYEFFLERLLEIQSKHLYIFNQSPNSGSLIDLIHISDKILELFFDCSNPSTIKISPTEIFRIIMNASHPGSKGSTQDGPSKNEVKILTTEIENDINHIKEQVDFQNVENDMKISELMKYITKTSDGGEDELISIIEHMKIYESGLSINPLLFRELKEKSFIICSSPYDLKSPTLPFRYFYIGDVDTISSHGGVFSSVIIDCLFHPNNEDINPKDFITHIQTIHDNLKRQFSPILKEQFTYTPTSQEHINQMTNLILRKTNRIISENTIIQDYKKYVSDLESYFNINYANNGLYSCPDNFALPNLKSILLSEKYWNVDITPVDVHEYDYLKIYDYSYFD